MIAGVVDRGMDTGVGTGLGLVRAGTVVLIARARATGMVIAVTATIAMVIAVTMTDGGTRSQLLVQAQSSAVRLHPRRHHRSIVHLPMAIAMRTSSGVIIAIGPIGPRTILSSRIMVLVSSVIRHTDSGIGLNSKKPSFKGGFIFCGRSLSTVPVSNCYSYQRALKDDQGGVPGHTS